MKIFIKNMVAQGTRRFVLMELKKLGLKLISFESGEMEFENELSGSEQLAVELSLEKYGLEILDEGLKPEQYSGYSTYDSSKYFDDPADMDEELEIAEVSQTS